MSQATQIAALKIAEEFMSGFEGDEMQEGIDEKLSSIRAAIENADKQPPLDDAAPEVPDDTVEAPKPVEFTVNVAMDVRAYGYVTVTDMTLDEALKQCTARFIADNFQPNGGSDDLDYTTPASISLLTATWYDQNDELCDSFVEIDLPDDSNVAAYTSLNFTEAQVILSAWSVLEDLRPEEKTLKERLSAFVAIKAAN